MAEDTDLPQGDAVAPAAAAEPENPPTQTSEAGVINTTDSLQSDPGPDLTPQSTPEGGFPTGEPPAVAEHDAALAENPADPTSEGAVRARVASALSSVVDRSLAIAVENAIVVAVNPAAAATVAPDDATANTTLSVNPATQEPMMVSDGTVTLTDGTVVPVSRDETHDSIDPNGALTPEAIAKRQDLSGADTDRVAAAQAELDTINARIKAVEDEDAAKEQELADLRSQAQTKALALQEAKDTLAKDEADEAAARAAGVEFDSQVDPLS